MLIEELDMALKWCHTFKSACLLKISEIVFIFKCHLDLIHMWTFKVYYRQIMVLLGIQIGSEFL
jgi:hypothetical protein